MLRNFFRFPRLGRMGRRPRLDRGSINRLDNLRKQTLKSKDDETKKGMSVDKGIKKYEKRQLNAKGGVEKKFFTLQTIVIILIILITSIYVIMNNRSVPSIIVGMFVFMCIILYLLIIGRYKENVEIEEEIKEIKVERERERGVFLDKVKEIEEVEKNQIYSIILKNSEDCDKKVWKIGRATALLIGKKTPRNKVDIDVTDSIYSNLISRVHGSLNRVSGTWYYEDLRSRNGSGLEKKTDGRKIKLKPNSPVKVESGDIIYLATTKILLK